MFLDSGEETPDRVHLIDGCGASQNQTKQLVVTVRSFFSGALPWTPLEEALHQVLVPP